MRDGNIFEAERARFAVVFAGHLKAAKCVFKIVINDGLRRCGVLLVNDKFYQIRVYVAAILYGSFTIPISVYRLTLGKKRRGNKQEQQKFSHFGIMMVAKVNYGA